MTTATKTAVAGDDDRPAHMESAIAAGYLVQLNGLLCDLERWQRDNNHIADFRTTGMIESIAQAARMAELLVRGVMGIDHRLALRGFRKNYLQMTDQQIREVEAAEDHHATLNPLPEDSSELPPLREQQP